MATQTPPKTMSSRLLTMKFMQRAANSTSPASSSLSASEDQSSKRRKVSHDPSTPNVDALADQAAVQSALAEEERKREEAVERRATESGDSHWVLDLPRNTAKSSSLAQTPMNVVQVGYAQLDRLDGAESDESAPEDIQPFRRYNMDKKVSKDAESDSDDSGSDSSSSADSSDDGGQGRRSYGHGGSGQPSASKRSDEIRKNLQNKRNAEKAKASQLAEKRRKKEVKLNSISGGGGLSSISGARPAGRNQTPMKCHSCGSGGHKAAECKKSPARNRR